MDHQVIARCYLRVSTEEQAVSGYSLAGQREKLELFARLQGYSIGGWYLDEGVSAKDLNRPAFQRMMGDARRGDVIVAYKLDRLTRSVRDLDDLLRRFEVEGLHFRSVTEQFDTTTATGRLMIRMVAEFAQWERETIAERTAFGKQKKVAAGEWGGGRPPFGYALEPSDRVKGGRRLMRLVPDPATAPVVVRIFERYLSGHGLRGIATWLNEEMGARSALGRPFDAVKVGRILQNPMYLGRLKSRGGWVQSSHEPLVSVAVFAQVQATFVRRKQMAPRQATGAYPLSGVARCGVCGGPICVQKASRRSRQAGQYWYKCRNYSTGRGCGERSLTSVPGPAMEERVVAVISQMGAPAALQAFFAQMEAEDEQRFSGMVSEAEQVERAMAEASRAIVRWDQLYETGRLGVEEYLERTEPHRERLRVLRGRREGVRNPPGPQPKGVPADFTGAFRAIWEAADPHERKALLQHFVSAWGVTICLGPGQRLELRWGGLSAGYSAESGGG